MVPLHLLQHDHPRSRQPLRPRHLGRHEQPGCRRRSEPRSRQRRQRHDLLPHGRVVLLRTSPDQVHRHQGGPHLRNVRTTRSTARPSTDTPDSLGYAPYAAGLYTNNRFGIDWLMLLGGALCGISAGVFWSAEAAIAIAYPEPWNRGKALGYWLTYRLVGQILGGSINLGLNADRDQAGAVSYTVYLVFIAIQCCGPFVAAFLTPPNKVERTDGQKVHLAITDNPWLEMRATLRSFLNPRFLLLLVWIGQAVFAEAVYFTYLARKSSQHAPSIQGYVLTSPSVVHRSLPSPGLSAIGHRRRHLWQSPWRESNASPRVSPVLTPLSTGSTTTSSRSRPGPEAPSGSSPSPRAPGGSGSPSWPPGSARKGPRSTGPAPVLAARSASTSSSPSGSSSTTSSCECHQTQPPSTESLADMLIGTSS